jgi:osmotically-inducible protein OsmY
MRRAYGPNTDQWLDDDELQQRILERIDSDHTFWGGRGQRKTKAMIAVDVEEGYVTLSGIVRSASERRRADILARALGARGVENRLQIEADADVGAKAS